MTGQLTGAALRLVLARDYPSPADAPALRLYPDRAEADADLHGAIRAIATSLSINLALALYLARPAPPALLAPGAPGAPAQKNFRPRTKMIPRPLLPPLAALPLLLSGACTADKPGDDTAPPSSTADLCGVPGLTAGSRGNYPMDSDLHIGMIQARGTHNSYHLPTEPVLDASWRYTQPTLTDQFATYGVRQIELDLHRRDDGGWEVFHIPVVDEGSTCRSFTDCLSEICAFSVAHPDHAPITVWMEPKDDLDDAAEGYQPIAADAWADLEATIQGAIPGDHLLTPDGWRRDQATLAEASAALGPPALAEARGRVLFALLDTGAHREAYIGGDPALTGRLLFADGWIGDPWAALIKDASGPEVADLLAAGLVVTSNVDSAADDAATNTASRDAALADGLNYAASDFPAPGSGPDGYWMELPGADPARCNPLAAPDGCLPEWIE